MAKDCGSCGKGSSKPKPKDQTTMTGKTMSFTLTLNRGGTRKIVGSQLEAEAALVRLGGGTISY